MIHQSANRPQLLLGCDRELILFAALMAAVLIFSLVTWWGIVAGVTLWFIAVAVLSRMGMADPLLRPVYLRHIQYQGFYPAKSPLTARSIGTPRNWG